MPTDTATNPSQVAMVANGTLTTNSVETSAGEVEVSAESPCLFEEDTAVMEAGFLTIDSSGTNSASPQPSTSSPFNFAILASLIGMAFGLVGSPWLEKWQQKLRAEKNGGSDEQ